MLLNGIPVPKVGSVRDRVLFRMFAMEQSRQYEAVATICQVISAVSAGSQAAVNSVRAILDNYHDTLGYRSWSLDKKKEQKNQQLSDEEMMHRVASLSDT